MALVYAAVIPHSPLLIKAVAKDHYPLLDETIQQIQAMVNDNYAAKSEIIIWLSPHGPAIEQNVVILTADHFTGNLEEFGDIETKVDWPGATGPAHHLKTIAEQWQLPVSLQTTESLDYGFTVPLSFFTSTKSNLKIIPISVGHLPFPQLIRLGSVLYEFMVSSNIRFSIIASAEFSRRHRASADERRRPTAEEKTISQAITAVDPAQLANLKPRPGTCGLNPVVALLATLQNAAATGRIASFQAPLGVGLITAHFSLNHEHRPRHPAPTVAA